MKRLFESIQDVLTGSPLEAILTGSLHYDYAQQDAVVPYGVCFALETNDISTFDATILDVTIQIQLYSDHADPGEIFALQNACIETFNGATLHPTGRPDVILRQLRITNPFRTGDDDERYWQSNIEFNCLYQQNERL